MLNYLYAIAFDSMRSVPSLLFLVPIFSLDSWIRRLLTFAVYLSLEFIRVFIHNF